MLLAAAAITDADAVVVITAVSSCGGSPGPGRLPLALSDELAAEPTVQQVWQAFRARARGAEAPLAQTMRELRALLGPWLEHASTADATT